MKCTGASIYEAGYLNSRFACGCQLVGVLGFSELRLAVNSAAVATADGLGCVLALDANASGAITAQGNPSVVLNGCSLYDNSQSKSALTMGGSAQISALSF